MSLIDALTSGQDPAALLARYPVRDFDSQGFRRQVQQAEAMVSAWGPAAFDFEPGKPASLRLGDAIYHVGTFSTPSLGELKARLEPIKQTAFHPLRLSILLGASRLGDIQYLETHADGDTLFQLASQFNGLEAPSATLVPVSAYFGDRTQGPLGVLPTFTGALLRQYAAPGPGGRRFVQTARQQLNFLADVLPPEIGRVQNGYLVSQNILQPQALADKLSSDFDAIRIGLHTDLHVVAPGGPRLDQVLTSTLAGGGYSQADTRQQPWLTIQRQLLRAAYLGTLLAALDAGRHKVVLTAIGGGVFANPHPLIWEAILWSLEQVEPYLKAPLHVILNLRSFEVAPEQLKIEARKRQGELVEIGTGS